MEHTKILHFDELHPKGGDCHVTLTERQAIDWARKAHPDRYETDELALEDFITIHWAYYETN